MSAKLATLGLIKLKVTWNKGYDIMIFVHDISSMYIWGFRAKNHKMEKPKFPNLLILEHFKNHFIEFLNKFLMCFEINGLKNLTLAILWFFARNPHIYILL